MDSMITPEMEALVGREYRSFTSFPIAASDIRRWAIAVYYPEPPPRLYWDEDYAAQTRWGGIVAPEEFNPFSWMRAEPKGDIGNRPHSLTPEVLFGVTPPPTRAHVMVGIETEHTGVRMRPGDVIRASARLAGYSERVGRLGLMLFTTTEDRWVNQHDELVQTNRTTLIRYE